MVLMISKLRIRGRRDKLTQPQKQGYINSTERELSGIGIRDKLMKLNIYQYL